MDRRNHHAARSALSPAKRRRIQREHLDMGWVEHDLTTMGMPEGSSNRNQLGAWALMSMSLEENISHCFREYPKMKDRIEDLESLVDELAMLIRMLVHSIRKTNPDNETARKAVDYLQRHDLQGLILRSDPPTHAALRDEVERLKDENRRIELLEAELVLLQDAGEQGRLAGAEAALRYCWVEDYTEDDIQRGLQAINQQAEDK